MSTSPHRRRTLTSSCVRHRAVKRRRNPKQKDKYRISTVYPQECATKHNGSDVGRLASQHSKHSSETTMQTHRSTRTHNLVFVSFPSHARNHHRISGTCNVNLLANCPPQLSLNLGSITGIENAFGTAEQTFQRTFCRGMPS